MCWNSSGRHAKPDTWMRTSPSSHIVFWPLSPIKRFGMHPDEDSVPRKDDRQLQHFESAESFDLSTTAKSEGSMPTTSAPPNHDSVLPDLMRVYENLRQSSTPQTQPTEQHRRQYASMEQPTQPSSNYYESQPQASETFQYPQGNWGFEAMNIPVPPIPEAAYNNMDSSVGVESNAAPQHVITSSGRTSRKRTALNLKDDSSVTSSTRGAKGRKKNKDSDGRWSKRFTWPEELHRDFVSAIFDVGLKHSSPATVLEYMPKHEQITSERIKSHLQKYRLHRAKSKKDFMTSYDASIKKFQDEGMENVASLSGGEVAGHLVYATLSGKEPPEPSSEDDANHAAPPAVARQRAVVAESPGSGRQTQGSLMLPRLTEEEKRSPMGASLGYLMGLFFSLKQQLMAQRAAKSQAARANQPVNDVFDSFVAGKPPVSAQGYAGDAATGVARAPGGPTSSRSTLEESNMMKREMQNQMAFQNKMRALKQQELNKYKRSGDEAESDMPQQPQQFHRQMESTEEGQVDVAEAETKLADYEGQEYQGAGETAADITHERNIPRGLSLGNAEDFWNTDVVDEQLFEFLMNN